MMEVMLLYVCRADRRSMQRCSLWFAGKIDCGIMLISHFKTMCRDFVSNGHSIMLHF